MGSPSYTPRHGGAPGGRRSTAVVRSAIRRPVVGGAIAVAMLGSVGATVAMGDPSHPGETTAATVSESSEPRDSGTADTARLAEDRRTANVSRSASREQDRRAVVERKKAAQKKQKAEEAKKKAEAERKAKARKKAREDKKAEEATKPVSEREFTADQLAQVRKDPKPYAIELMREHGWGDDEWGCLDSLWIGESDWEWDATNSSSGAYGIPQSLPATKMKTAGDDWKTNPVTQMKWGLDYIEASYGSPCEAKSFWDSKDPHWY